MKSARLILATHNKGKLREIRSIFNSLAENKFKIISLDDIEEEIPEITEDAGNYSGNALKKAKAIAIMTGENVIADDSGLEVDALGGRPGPGSRRFAGEKATDRMNTRKLLRRMTGVPSGRRKASFICCAVAFLPGKGTKIACSGRVKGYIAQREFGKKGFGYDPVFYYPGFGKTFGQIGQGRKNSVSHRMIAFRELAKRLAQTL